VIKRYTNPQLLYFTPSAPLLTQMPAMISGGGNNVWGKYPAIGQGGAPLATQRSTHIMPTAQTPPQQNAEDTDARSSRRQALTMPDRLRLSWTTHTPRPAGTNELRPKNTFSLSQSTSRAGQNALSTRISAKQITAHNPCISCPVFAAERDKAIWICAFCIVSRSRSTMTVFAALVRFYRATLSASAVFAMGLCVFLSATSQSSTKTAKRTFVVSTDMARRAVPRR